MFEFILISISGFFLYLFISKKNAYDDLIRKHLAIKSELFGMVELKAKNSQDIENLEDRVLDLEEIVNVQNQAVEDLANHFVNDSLKYIGSAVTASNYESSIRKSEKVFAQLKKLNIEFPETDEKQFYDKIKQTFEDEVRRDEARKEQLLIKERIREEQKSQKEKEEEIKKLEKQTETIQVALEKAKQKFKDEHSVEVEELRRQLQEAMQRAERVKSQAELTKSGFVYVISNMGAFGEKIFKVGMTRRLEPQDRVKELSDASVPFPFDVHMMISCEDAPALETNLHRDLHTHRLNKVNMHKEFFKVELDVIAKFVEKHHAKVEYRAHAEAFEFRETLLIEERNSLPEYNIDTEEDEEAIAC